MRARELMRSPVVTIAPDRPVSELAELLVRKRITGAPVVEADRVVGIVSRTDLVSQLEVERSRAEAAAYYLEPHDVEQLRAEDLERIADTLGHRWTQLRIRDVMRRDILSIGPEAGVREVAELMVRQGVHRLLVIDGEQLLGVISSLDLVREIAEARLEPK